jgi:hypothetical protein
LQVFRLLLLVFRRLVDGHIRSRAGLPESVADRPDRAVGDSGSESNLPHGKTESHRASNLAVVFLFGLPCLTARLLDALESVATEIAPHLIFAARLGLGDLRK